MSRGKIDTLVVLLSIAIGAFGARSSTALGPGARTDEEAIPTVIDRITDAYN